MPALPVVISRVWLGYGQACLGNFAEGIAMAEDALRKAEGSGHPYSIAAACRAWAFPASSRATFRAPSNGSSAPPTSSAPEASPALGAVEIFLGRALSLAGRHAEAIAILEDGAAYTESIQFMALHGLKPRLAGRRVRALRASGRRNRGG